jgi:uncharacterized protein YbaP (TraB family)
MLKFLATLLLLFFALTLQAAPACRGKTPVDYQPIATRYQTGLLFKVGKCGEAPSFILGTVHSDDPAIIEAASAAFAILPHAKAAGFEYIEPKDADAITQKYLFLNIESKQTLPLLIGEKDFSILAPKLLQMVGVDTETASKLKPWAAAVMLQYPLAVNDGIVLDMRLQQEARNSNVPLFGLETMEQQFQIFDTIPQTLQIEMLRETLHDATIDEMNNNMIEAYKAKDLRTIQNISTQSFAQIKNRDLAAMLESRVVRQRNHRMVKNLHEELKQGHRLIAVGALHLTGKEGLLRLLERKGYLIDPIP